ncbi:MAG: hypothetical protein A2Y59_02515 [Chloroflexi bacterium RBG_13_52_14]|nr:MAG: hypothetical protein A2Y59_02515 [Chloroflexi bacterium RBG_13_52_14]
MWLAEGVAAGIIAGVFMVVVSEIGYRLGVFKSSLIIIDGSFAIRRPKMGDNQTSVYVFGTFVHFVTSAVFGLVYSLFPRFIKFDAREIYALAPYVFFLWVAMLFVALPIAGQGILGSKSGRFAWLEQLVIHSVFGVGFWWALGVV